MQPIARESMKGTDYTTPPCSIVSECNDPDDYRYQSANALRQTLPYFTTSMQLICSVIEIHIALQLTTVGIQGSECSSLRSATYSELRIWPLHVMRCRPNLINMIQYCLVENKDLHFVFPSARPRALQQRSLLEQLRDQIIASCLKWCWILTGFSSRLQWCAQSTINDDVAEFGDGAELIMTLLMMKLKILKVAACLMWSKFFIIVTKPEFIHLIVARHLPSYQIHGPLVKPVMPYPT